MDVHAFLASLFVTYFIFSVAYLIFQVIAGDIDAATKGELAKFYKDKEPLSKFKMFCLFFKHNFGYVLFFKTIMLKRVRMVDYELSHLAFLKGSYGLEPCKGFVPSYDVLIASMQFVSLCFIWGYPIFVLAMLIKWIVSEYEEKKFN